MSRNSRLAQMAVPLLVVGIVVVMIVPLPTMLLDLFLASSISLSVLVLLTAMFVKDALEFSVFPALLLITTLFRLALNVSSARLILLNGFAGKVIEAFGHFVVGGNLVVGLVIFLILVVIQFAVITAGAGRVAEVAARFTLDAMPGKQMAIDADLNAGLITDEQARRRRREISLEADFYGAMDGASKFVKGDAVAAVVIVAINLLGGFAVGVLQHHLSIGEAVQRYALLSVGDGLVSQIPALLISMSSGLIVTRAATEADLGTDLLQQFTRYKRALQVGGGFVIALALIPGLPKLPFVVVGACALLVAGRLHDEPEPGEGARAALAAGTAPAAEIVSPDSPQALAAEMRVEPLELEIAYDLVDLVDPARGGDLLDRVRALRRKLAVELGVVIPLVRTRDNLELPLSTYAIRVHGVELGRGEAPPGCVLVLGDDLTQFPGSATREPVFGLPAVWMPAEARQQAELAGATVVDRASVITTHLAEIARTHASRLLSRQDVKSLLDMVRATDSVVADEVSSSGLTLGEIQRVLQELLDEGVAVRDLVRICEALTARAAATRDPEMLAEAARGALGPAISAAHAVDNRLPVITLEPLTEQALLEQLRPTESGVVLALDPNVAELLATVITREAESAEQRGDMPVLVCSPRLRLPLRKLVRISSPRLPVLSYQELGPQLELDTVGVVNLANAPVGG
ncbi:MAG TPA: flagellar biosynthesis protein FlhA [Acidimicrobiia bacterium]|nr:flagellar biosynthesis protein FlhA [Acidimicrobiia bacterium]